MSVMQAQILLALIGAVVMLIVGSSLARAFGILGIASLIRYRAKIEDPKDAGVLLAALAVGLASGVGQYLLAALATLFTLAVLWVIESVEPQLYKVLQLRIATPDPPRVRPEIERVLRRHHAEFELRMSNGSEVRYAVRLPIAAHTNTLSDGLLGLPADVATEFEWKPGKG